MTRAIALVAAAAWVSCSSPAFDEPQVLGGVEVSHVALERGRQIYRRNCLPCHGEHGDGQGPAATTSWPPPRDFTRATFKYAGIADRGLPADAELARIIAGGLAGTSMPAWDLPDPELADVIDYIKTFSPAGKGFRDPALKVSTPEIPADPGRSAASVAEGERIYHELFECAKCHPAYVTKDRYKGLRAFKTGEPAPKWSENYRVVLVPTDFRRHPMRSVRRDDAGRHDARDLFRVIAYGLQGPMPGYRHLGDDKIWPVVHYVQSLADERGPDRHR